MNNSFAYPAPTRPVVMGARGMVASANPMASEAGMSILHDGGNAFDAAVAVGATLGVVEPFMSGPGGLGVALAYVAKEGKIRALDFSGRAPQGAFPDRFTPESKEVGVRSSLVPGNVAGWLEMHEKYGVLDRERLFQSAIRCAEDGFGVTYYNHRYFLKLGSRLKLHPASAALLFTRNGDVPKPGQRHAFTELAESYRKIAKLGRDVFYLGEIAEKIVQTQKELGGLITQDDLASYETSWIEPLHVNYRGYDLFTTPPNSTGFQILETMKIMETYKPLELAFQHPDTVHSFIESVKLAMTDRIQFGGDPDYVHAPMNSLLSDDYAKKQRQRIDPVVPNISPGESFPKNKPLRALVSGLPGEIDGGMTTHFAVADSHGNVVSVTQTLGGGFGSSVAMGDTGIFLNNMAYWFDLEEGAPNQIAPGKRVDFCLAPVQVHKGDRFLLSLSTPGSWGILQTTPQMLINVLDFGMNVQQAIDQPRLRVYEKTVVEMEERFPSNMRLDLENRGHEIRVLESWSLNVGGAQGIYQDPDEGIFQGGADPRRDGVAIGW